MKTSEVLNRAADLIEERGWGTGANAMRLDSPVLCIESACALAADSGADDTDPEFGAIYNYLDPDGPVYKALLDFLGARRGMSDDIWSWNDHKARNAAEVIEVLRAAAAIEQAREAEARGPLHTGPTVRVPAQPEPVGVA